MNRKLRKTLKEIYASEKPSEYPAFLKEIKKEREKKQFRFAAPVMAVFLVGFIGFYGYCNLLESRNHSAPAEQPTEEITLEVMKSPLTYIDYSTTTAPETTVQTNTVPETSTSEPALSAELSTTQTTVILETTHTITRTETTVPETSVTQIHLPNQTVTETVPEVPTEETGTFPPETTALPVPEMPSETTAVPETTSAPETAVTEETQESEWRCLDLSRISDVETLQEFYWELRRQEAMDWTMDGLAYAESGKQAEEMLSELEALHRENENPCYERYQKILDDNIYLPDDYVWRTPDDSYNGAWINSKEDYGTLMQEILADLENTISPDIFQAIQASQQEFQEKYDTFWEGDLQLSYEMGSPHTDYLETRLIQYRVLLLMDYFY